MTQERPTSDISQRFIEGDESAFNDLFDIHAPAVLGFLVNRLPSLADAEDISQVVWDRVWSKRDAFDGRHFRGWVFQIARNELVNWSRKAKRHATASLVDGDDRVQEESTLLSDREEELTRMSECMKKLSERLLQVITRIKLDGEAPVDVAKDVGTSRGQIDKDVHRAKAKLRACMESQQP